MLQVYLFKKYGFTVDTVFAEDYNEATQKFAKKVCAMPFPARVYAEIDLDAICKNAERAMDKVGADVRVMAVVKADAYGHGAVPVACALSQIGVYAFGVATVQEGAQLRSAGIQTPILVLGHVFPEEYALMLENDLLFTVFQTESAKQISDMAQRLQKTAKIHLKIDTGMGRIGLFPTAQSLSAIREIAALPALEVQGIFTHFACADEADKTSFCAQKDAFLSFVEKVEASGVHIPIRHMCNSAAVIDFSGPYLDMVRCGIMLYGLYPSDEVNTEGFPLLPAMQLKSRVAFVKTVGAGFPVSYGSTYTTEKETVIATIPVGYADGYPRALSGKGRVLIHGQYAKILGRICMDQCMVDVTDIPNVREGDAVTLVGAQGDKRISVEEVADSAYSFNYEFCCGIAKRVPRVYIRHGEVSGISDALD